MDSRIWVRGRVQSGPVEMDSAGDPITAFIVENEQTAPDEPIQQKTQLVPWCDVICVGELATNVLSSLTEGDCVIVEGELRIHRMHALDDHRDSALLAIRAETVSLDLSQGVARFLSKSGNPS
jgi:single-stranded DNA-binding protein